MRILHILNDVTGRGNGIVNTAVDLALEQRREGHEVAIISAGGEYEPLLQRFGVTHFFLDQSRTAVSLFRALIGTGRILHSFRPDVVHAHMRTGLLLSWVWTRVYRIPLVAHLHNIHDRESLLMGLADRVIAVSRSVADSIAQAGIPRNKIRIALNRTLGSSRQVAIAEVAPVSLCRPAIVTVGGMCHRKGIAELITAFESIAESFPDAHLYLVGDGPERALFEESVRESRWRRRIHFEGFQSQPQRYMLAADIFVLASRRESFGLVLIEAREAECAIVASNVDGIAEALDGGRAGILVPPSDPPALAEGLRRLLSDEDERQEWRRRASTGIEDFHVSAMASEVSEIYCELLKRKSSKLPRAAVSAS